MTKIKGGITCAIICEISTYVVNPGRAGICVENLICKTF